MSDIDKPLSETLPGTWELISRLDVSDAGEKRTDESLGADPIALLIYDRSGNFAAQFMRRDRSKTNETDAAAAGTNNSRAVGGYDAYFGSFVVDDVAGTVTQKIVGALSGETVGSVLTRAMQVDGDSLAISLRTCTPAGEPVTRTLIWKRVG